jgi:hypothetical protein
MDSFIHFVQILLLYLTNGALALSYGIWENLAALGAGAAFLGVGRRAPVVQRGPIAAAGGVAVLASVLAPSPVPVLLTVMAMNEAREGGMRIVL